MFRIRRGRLRQRPHARRLKAGVRGFLQKCGYNLVKLDRLPPSFFHLVLEGSYAASVERSKKYVFVQFGANDGISADPIHHFVTNRRLSGVAVEPQKVAFENLVRAYAHLPQIRCANLAVGREDGVRELYSVSQSFHDLFRVMYKRIANPSGVASFNREHVIEWLRKTVGRYLDDEEIDRCVICERVPTLTFETFVRSYQIEHIDLLQIDTEGFDFEIIKMMVSLAESNSALWPRVVHYEHLHLSPSDRVECRSRLLAYGYAVTEDSTDTCAFKGVLLGTTHTE